MQQDEDRILNPELRYALAKMGHTDVLVVADAGYPIPSNTDRIDLAFTPGDPSLREVLPLINVETIPERVMYAEAVPEMNPDYDDFLQDLYDGSGAAIETIPHEAIVEYGYEAKAIVRTGDLLPWGNVVIQCGTDPKAWFDGENLTMPQSYRERYKEMYGEEP